MALAQLIWNRLVPTRARPVRVDGIEFEQAFGFGNGTWAVAGGLDYDEDLREALRLADAWDTVLDLGANVGAYALRFAQVAGRVIAVEPNPQVARSLKKNADRNGLRLELEMAAVMDRSQEDRELCWRKGRPNTSSICYTSAQLGSAESVRVRTTSVDELVERLGVGDLRFVKMDIEGAESAALRGMKRTIARFRPIILFENSHPETLRELEAYGYRIGKMRRGVFTETRKGINLWAVPVQGV